MKNEQPTWNLIVQGDEEAFGCFYEQHHQGIYRFALQMSGSAAVAEDVTQDVFISLIRQPQAFDPARGALAAYLYGIARKKIFRALRDRRKFAAVEDQPALEPVSTDTPLAEFTKREQILLLQRAILSLPPRYREVVVLAELQELSYSEVSEITCATMGTVRSRLHRARSLLAKKLTSLQHRKRRIGDQSYGLSAI